MFQIIRDRREYSELREGIIQKAKLQCQQVNHPADEILIDAFKKANIMSVDGASVRGPFGKTKLRTPGELRFLLEIMLSWSPELSAYIVNNHIIKVLSSFDLPVELQGDIMMAFEYANYVLPQKTGEAARHLATALCVMPSLGRARATLKNLGCPYPTKPLRKSQIETLKRRWPLPEDVISSEASSRLGWNEEMRNAVFEEIEKIGSHAARLLRVQAVRNMKREPLRRWKQAPKPEAVELLQKGMELASASRFEEAVDVLNQAGEVDPLVLPDVLRNKAWILSKQKNYEEGYVLCCEALDIDPEYAEVWYLFGICLAQSKHFYEAFEAYEKAKSLGFESPGLEPNMATCRRAISDGMCLPIYNEGLKWPL